VVARLKLENARKIQLLRFNDEGTLLAVAVTDFHVLDGRSGKQVWHTDYQNGVIYFMEFHRDDSIVLMRSNQIFSRLDGKDGLIHY
jgi:hypothetical protein